MDLRDTLRVLRRNWTVVTACTLLGVGSGAVTSILIEPTYTADTELFVAIQGSGSVTELQQGNIFSQARVQSYVKTTTTPVVLQPAIESLGLDVTSDALAAKIEVTTDPETVLIDIAVSDKSAVQAAAIAQAVASSLIAAVEELEKPKAGGSSPVKLSIVRPAQAPIQPSAPNTKLALLSGLAFGVILGSAIAVLRSSLDTRVRGEADLRQVTQGPLLGGISFDADAGKRPLLTQTSVQSPRAESFRQIRTNLQFAKASAASKTVLVTSSVPGEGKTTTATNLALALASTGQSVCLIDADLRRPMVDDYLGLDRNAGLTTALLGESDINELLQPWGQDDLHVLTSGQIPPNPSELLGSEAMGQLLGRLEYAFDAVVIDAPPLLPVTDAAVLAQHVGGVVVVVGTHVIRKQQLVKSLAALEMVSAKIFGLVLNQLPIKGPDAYSDAYHAYESASDHSGNERVESGRFTSDSLASHTGDGRTLRRRYREAWEPDESGEGFADALSTGRERTPTVFPPQAERKSK